MKVKSNRFKCRNLPKNYEIDAKVKSKSVGSLIFMTGAGFVLIFQEAYFFIGLFLIVIGGYTLLFTRNYTTVEFSEDFVIFYLDDCHEECYLIYYNDIESYEYKRRLMETDIIKIRLKNRRTLEFKSLDRFVVKRNMDKHVHVKQLEDDEE